MLSHDYHMTYIITVVSFLGVTRENPLQDLSLLFLIQHCLSYHHLRPVAFDVAEGMYPVSHVLRGLSQQVERDLLLGDRVEGLYRKAAVQMMLLGHSTEYDLCYSSYLRMYIEYSN